MRLFPLAILLSATAGAQTARYRVIQNEKPIGWATVSRVLRGDGGKEVTTTMEIGTRRTRTVARYAADGSTVSRRIELLGPSDRVVGSRGMRVGATAVEIVTDDHGARTVRTASLSGGTADASEGWFWQSRPEPGAKITAHVFDLASVGWRSQTTEYVGPSGEGFLIRQTAGDRTTEAILDAQGMPIRLSTPAGLRMMRLLTQPAQPGGAGAGKKGS